VISRIWRGWTTPENAGAYLLRRRLDDEVEFATILLFDTLEQVRAFAAEDYEAACAPGT
jgi:hypothetical protein